MNYIKYILIITFSTSVISGDYSDQRGMTKLLGTETTLRCACLLYTSDAADE